MYIHIHKGIQKVGDLGLESVWWVGCLPCTLGSKPNTIYSTLIFARHDP